MQNISRDPPGQGRSKTSRPDGFAWERFGCRTNFQFPIVKLTDLHPRLDEGRQEGLMEGKLEGARQMVASLLAGRFGALPQGLEESLAAVADLDELRGLALRAAQVTCLEEFSAREA